MRELEVAFSALVVLVHLLLVGGVQCPLPDEATGDHVSICAMCSDSSAAVRLRVRENEVFETLLLRYECSDENGTVVYQGSSGGLDPCFNPSPVLGDQGLSTGTYGVGYQLWAGLQCEFRVAYRTERGRPTLKSSHCTIKSPETCADSPDECVIDRVSSLNEEGECEFYCTPGYSGQLCNNRDECLESDICHANAECHDTHGSYWCECRPGFQGDGHNCTDINECGTQSTMCGKNAECINTEGSFSCECIAGFFGDGYNCTDINECGTQSTMCGKNAECINTEGSFSCQCIAGFSGDGYNCTDINECICGENAECVNTEGNYICQCDPGFTGDGYNCTDIDECYEAVHDCSAGSFCVNHEGNYHCKHNALTSEAILIAITTTTCIITVLLIVTVAFLITRRTSIFVCPTLANVNTCTTQSEKGGFLLNHQHTRESNYYMPQPTATHTTVDNSV